MRNFDRKLCSFELKKDPIYKICAIRMDMRKNYGFCPISTLLEKISAGMAEKARGGNFLLVLPVLPYCKKFSAIAAEKYDFQL
jgi:hypothetical protein